MAKGVLGIVPAFVLSWIALAQQPAASLRIYPADVSLWGDAASQRFVVLFTGADGVEKDVTSAAALSVSDPAKGEIDPTGKFTSRANGTVRLSAKFSGGVAQAAIATDGAGKHRPFSFARDIGGIFTRRGCNNSDCHGGVKGKGGYKLSINALHPDDDYRWTVEGGTFDVLSAEPKGPRIPRIDRQEPEKSLLLAKATLQVVHGGGRRFELNSADAQAILKWVRAGAPLGEASGDQSVSIEGVEVFPPEVILQPGEQHRLLVTAKLSNGRREDITDQVLYLSSDKEVVEAKEGGVLRANKTGETAILIRAAGHAVSARVGVIGQAIQDYPTLPTRNYIDQLVFAKLRRFNILPSAMSTDEEFLRRVCLDATGTLPPPQRVREFVADRDPNKRDHLIETLLESPEFTEYWGFRLSDLLRATFVTSNNAFEVKAFEDWILNSVAMNKPFSQIAIERIAAQGYSAPARNFYYVAERVAPEVLMPELIRVFMGRRIDCAQCHNHPFEAWSQNQFWGLSAFFGGVTELRASRVFVDTLGPDHPDKSRDMSVIHPRTKEHVVPAYLSGEQLPQSLWTDPRMELAKWVVAHPYFAEATANRIWGYFFGRGIVDPVDDFRSTNPPTHPELLAALASDLESHGYDLKHLMRTIMQSRTYQLSSVPNETNRDDRLNYSRAQPRALEAAVLLDAISTATGVPEDFRYHWMAGGGDPEPGARAVEMIPDVCPSQFMDAFGRSMRKAPPSGAPQPNLSQALHMLAGETYTSKISRQEGRLAKMMSNGASNDTVLDEFYLAALTRQPTANEKQSLLKMMADRPAQRQTLLEGLVWAIISSREFTYNH
jgi:hypothetical protein